MRYQLLELWLAMVRFFLNLKDFVLGFFYMGFNLERKRRSKELQDSHKFYNDKVKTRMLKFRNKEKIRNQKIMKGKGIFKRFRENYVVNNYLNSVLVELKPHATIQQALSEQYGYLHPYLMGYYGIFTQLKKFSASGEKADLRLALAKAAALPDMLAIATEAMKYRKEVSVEFKRREIEMRKHKLTGNRLHDTRLIKDQVTMLQKEIEEKKKLVKDIAESHKIEERKEKELEAEMDKALETKEEEKSAK